MKDAAVRPGSPNKNDDDDKDKKRTKKEKEFVSVKNHDYFEEAQSESKNEIKGGKLSQMEDTTSKYMNDETEDYIGKFNDAFGGVFNKELFHDIRKQTTKNAAPLISKIAQNIEK